MRGKSLLARRGWARALVVVLGVLVLAGTGMAYRSQPAEAVRVLPDPFGSVAAGGSASCPDGRIFRATAACSTSFCVRYVYLAYQADGAGSWIPITEGFVWRVDFEFYVWEGSLDETRAWPGDAHFVDVRAQYWTFDGWVTSTVRVQRPCTAELTVIKEVINHVGTPALPGDWQIDISAGNPTLNHFPGAAAPGTTLTVDAGAYSVGESGGPDGYTATPSAGCSGTAATDGSYTCTIVNEQDPTGTLTIRKESDPADDTPFAFSGDVSTGTSCVTVLGGGGACQSAIMMLEPFELRDPSAPARRLGGPGIYRVTEGTVPAGWWLDDVVCTGAAEWDHTGPALAVTVGRDEQVVCTFHNERLGRIVVNKVVSPVDAPAAEFDFEATFGDFSLAGGESHDSGLIPPGLYSVEEVLPLAEGWSLASAFCGDGSMPSVIGVSPGETVTCTFNNRYESEGGSLTVVKVTNPAGGGGFVFDGTLGPFSLDDGGSRLFDGLAAGEYSVSESLPAGWEFEDAVCTTVPGAAVDYEVVGSGVTVNLAEGQDVTCVFSNREEETVGPEGSLTIIKQTVPTGGEGFAFDAGPLGTFSLDDGGVESFTGLAAGEYTVSETPAADWAFASVECDALDYTTDGASVTVNLAEGEAAVCTFTNGELPYTGSSLWLPTLLGGLFVMLMGLGVWVRGLMKRAEI